jgi:hypothetical protein
MKPAHPGIKKQFLSLRHALAREGFGSEILENNNRVLFVQVLSVYDGRQIKTALQITPSFKKLRIFEQVEKLKTKIQLKMN